MSSYALFPLVAGILIILTIFSYQIPGYLQEIISNQETIINLLNSTKIIGQEIMK